MPVTSKHTQHGFSLVELMIAITIAVVLGLGLVQVFSAQRVAFAANESLARVQENSRFALGFIEHDLRMTGNMTCLNDQGFAGRLFNHLSADVPAAAPWLYRIDQAFQVYEFVGTAPGQTYGLAENRTTPAADAWAPPLPADLGIAGKALDGSDIVVVRYMSAESTVLTGIGVEAAAGTLDVADPSFLSAGRVYAVSDCRNFSLFQALGGKSVGVGGLNLVGWSGLENSYGPDVPLHRFEFAAYYVATGADGGPALFRRQFDDSGTLASEELVAGVESVQVVLGADTALRDRGDRPSSYFTAAAVEEGAAPWPADASASQRWSSVTTARVGVLVRSETRASAAAPTAPSLVADVRLEIPADSRLRHVYETQVALRNRIRG
ncbi:PilW family protein [Chiayiivirga flava]|uniref:Type IV pilus assembly protein PilW n=1 Tax=Chiayiivirga flava TaxID=659595 RepID=A0A7W8FZ76_9GAMM|nr:PilW family protein [Chiayiivirga flava]MBB5208147.1 type IV pilus assembly protein PilW [Chiayiivirga flava]